MNPEPGPDQRKPVTPQWLRPDGVSVGNWDYVRSGEIAKNYDQFLENDPLTLADGQLLRRYLPPVSDSPGTAANNDVPLVVDFGCGNGRSLIPLLERGYRGLGIDLSHPMLTSFRQKCLAEDSGELHLVEANLVELDAIATNSADVGLCMFSTLGMIQKRSNRRKFLSHVSRILKPGSPLIVHAHNLWFQLRSPAGVRTIVKQLWQSMLGKIELGDRVANYRGLRNVFIHSFRRRELIADLTTFGLLPRCWHSVLPGRTETVEGLPWFSSYSTVGWVVVCDNRKPITSG
ncbi:MAG: class I SAM-dependent methyltransferase [Planctomycetota bacterium]